METANYTTSITVDQTAGEAFAAICNVAGWWTRNCEGGTAQTGDVFTVRFGETYITSKVTELIPERKIVWQVIDCNKHWLKDKKEWNGTTMQWGIAAVDGKTQIRFTHLGLVDRLECFGVCVNAWGGYISGSLLKLITEGKGNPS